MWNPSKGLSNLWVGGQQWRFWGLKDLEPLMITLQSPVSPTGENFSGITGWRLDQWKRTQQLQLSMSITPTMNVKIVSNLIMEFPKQLLQLTRIEEIVMGKETRIG
jgi:hypothetical protein